MPRASQALPIDAPTHQGGAYHPPLPLLGKQNSKLEPLKVKNSQKCHQKCHQNKN